MQCVELWEIFNQLNIDFFTGVPDSTFKAWMTFLDHEHGKNLTNIIACNECEAVAIAAGYHLATGRIGAVYMQNAGEGKTVNPVTSLCDPEVYSIPLLLMIGWRGEPGMKDEPQHGKMGKITLQLLDLLSIPYKLLSGSTGEAESAICELVEIAEKESKPVALIIRKGDISDFNMKKPVEQNYDMKREDAIKLVVDNLSSDEIILSTTGKTSRELFEYRMERKDAPKDFYTVGSMGCVSAIALGIATQKPDKRVVILDGDGSVLMQMGSLATIGHYAPRNLFHILIDNVAYDSTGGQPTVSSSVNFEEISLACGYEFATTVVKKDKLVERIRELETRKGPAMIVVKVNKGARADLGRPTATPAQNKAAFIGYVQE